MKSDLSQGSTSCMKLSRMHRFAASVDQAPRIDICLSASKMQVPWSEHIESNKRNNWRHFFLQLRNVFFFKAEVFQLMKSKDDSGYERDTRRTPLEEM